MDTETLGRTLAQGLVLDGSLLLGLFEQAPVAVAMFAGPTHIYQFANPRYHSLVNRTRLVGLAVAEAFPELADSAILNVFDTVYRSGEPFVTDKFSAPLDRGDGLIVERFFTFNLEPVRDRDGQVFGLMAVASEVTAQVERTRQLQLSSSVGRALSGPEPASEKLRLCTIAIVECLDAAFARIWSYNDAERVLELRASSGMYSHLDGPHRRVPLGQFKIGKIAAERLPHLTNDVLDDPRVSDKAWARREGMVSFAGYPLLYEGRLMGVMALFGRRPLDQTSLDTLGAVADQIALGMERERVERFRDMFVGMLGHDLRNPINAIKLGAEALSQSPSLAEPSRAVAARMRSSAERMGRLVAQLLDVTRARTIGSIPLTRQLVDLYTLVIDTVDEIRQGQPGRVILVSLGGDTDAHGEWDRDRLSQVFSNLIGNAATYGTVGAPVRIHLSGQASMACEIQNAGVIPPSELRALFDPDRRLGLFIVKEIIASHGGTLTVTSTPESGTTFRLEIPRS